MNKSNHLKIADMFIVAFISVIGILCLVPMVHILALSLSSNGPILSGKVTLFPIDLDFSAYKAVFAHAAMIRSLLFTIVMVSMFTAIAMIMTVTAAYPLTKKNLKGRNFFLFLIVFTMFFSGGIIPEYLLVRNLNLLDTIWALILPGAINAFYLLIMKTFFSAIPVELEESARMDGASHFRILKSIILPLSLPALATLSLFYAVGRWNTFQDALFYITDPKLYPIQLKLYALVISGQTSELTVMEAQNAGAPVPESLKAASIMFGTIPILIVYPWLQRYFISGVMIGAVKG